MGGVDHAFLGAARHAGAADEVGVAVDGHDLARAGGCEDVLHDGGGGFGELFVVVALAVGEVRDGQAVAVFLVGQGDPVVGLGQVLAQRAEGGPVDVVAHVLP